MLNFSFTRHRPVLLAGTCLGRKEDWVGPRPPVSLLKMTLFLCNRYSVEIEMTGHLGHFKNRPLRIQSIIKNIMRYKPIKPLNK